MRIVKEAKERKNEILDVAERLFSTNPLLEKLTRTIISLNAYNKGGNMIMEEVHRPQNALMNEKMEDMLLGRVNRLITIIAEDGIKQGALMEAMKPIFYKQIEQIFFMSNKRIGKVSIQAFFFL